MTEVIQEGAVVGKTAQDRIFNWGSSQSFTDVIYSGLPWPYSGYGGAVDNYNEFYNPVTNTVLEYKNADFYDNSANYGGAVDNYYATFSINGGNFIRNNAERGGAVYNEGGVMNFDNVYFSANSGTNGGVFMNGSNGNISVSHANFLDNKGTNGGVLYNTPGKAYKNCAFSAYDALFSGNSGVIGGAVYNYFGTASFDKANFSGNTASRGGGAFLNAGGSMTIVNASIDGNKVVEGMGGAILNASNGYYTVADATVTNNSASWGGAVAFEAFTSATFDRVTFAGNSAQTGGAVLNNSGNVKLTDATFNQNIANAGGGAILNDQGTMNLTNAVFSGNSGFGFGGAVYNTSGGIMRIDNATFNDNYGYWGAAIAVASAAEMTVENASFAGNSANTGGGVNNNGGSYTQHFGNFSVNNANVGGAVYNNSGSMTLGVINYVGNTVNDKGNGGAICNLDKITIYGNLETVFSGNKTLGTNGTGGAIFNAGVMTLDIYEFKQNSAFWGGAIYNNESGNASVTSAAFTGNTATMNGGAILNNGTISVKNATFTGNTARWGGAVMNDSGTMRLDSCTFKGNTANDWGAAINCRNGSMYIGNTTISDEVSQWGGAIFNEWGSVTLEKVTFNNNEATELGGAYYNSSGTTIMSSATFTGNTATWGGAIVNEYSKLSIENGKFNNNSVYYANGGGAILNKANSELTLKNVSFSGNTGNNGGAILNEDSVIYAEDITLSTSTDTIRNVDGTIYLQGENILNAQISSNESAKVIFDLSKSGLNDDYLISNYSMISGGNLSLKVSASQKNGTYVIAENADSFYGSLQITVGDETLSQYLSVGSTVSVTGAEYTLGMDGSDLTLTVSGTNGLDTDVNLLTNGVSQILAWDSAQGKVGYMAADGNKYPKWRGVWEWSGADAALWRVAGVGHFKGSEVDYDGILLYNGVGNRFAAWTNIRTGSYGYVNLCKVDGSFNTQCLANLDGDEYDDILIYDTNGSIGVVLGGTTYKDIFHVNAGEFATWTIKGAGSFDEGMDKLVMVNNYNNQVYLWTNQDTTFNTWNWKTQSIGKLESGWEIAAVGDFEGDGIDDIMVLDRNTNNVWVWDDGNSSTKRWRGTLGEGFEIEAAGDYNGDGCADLLLREHKSGWGGLGYWGCGYAGNWVDLGARIETDMKSSFDIIA